MRFSTSIALCMVFALLLSAVAGYGQEQMPPADAPRVRPETLQFTMVNKENQPVAGARVNVRLFSSSAQLNQEVVTNERGIAEFKYPDGDEPVNLSATIRHPGLVPYYVNFGSSLIAESLPTEKRIQLEHGKKVGGTVVDEAGNPVAGARVSILVPATESPTELHFWLHEQATGEDGTWMLDGAPLDLKDLHIRVEHRQFLRADFPIEDSLDAKYTLNPGLKLTGRVTDETGNPIPTAHITVGSDRWGSVDEPTAVAKDGTYVVQALSEQATWVTAEAPGFAPAIKQAVINENTQPVDFNLTPGHTTRFLVVNDKGEPIEDASIVADTWNGFRTLWWRARTDKDGQAVWDGAPADDVTYHILRRGYSANRSVKVPPADAPHIVRLQAVLQITGTVVGTDRKKISEFRVELGRVYPGNREVRWLSFDGTAGRNGRFSIEHSEPFDNLYVRISADGFRPWVSEPIPFGKAEHQIFARLEPGSGPTGVVLKPDGTPASGAQLILVTESEGLQFTGDYNPHGGRQTIAADDDGQFSFQPVDEPALIVAVHESGYAEVPAGEFAESGKLQLDAWAKVEVLVFQGDKPLANANVNIDPQSTASSSIRIFSYQIDGITDASGKVIFDRVVPREANISQVVKRQFGSYGMTYSIRSERLSLEPGVEAKLTLGGQGANVSGKLFIPGDPPDGHEHRWDRNDPIRISSQDEANPANTRRYQALITDDGSFTFYDIPPGQYVMTVELSALPTSNRMVHGPRLGRIVHRFEVPEGTSEVDLETIQGEWEKRFGYGDKAPLFVAAGLNGEFVHMGDVLGKLVLLNFWSSSDPNSISSMDHLAELHREFGDDPRFTIFSVSVDQSLDEARASVNSHQWPWRFGFVGPGTFGPAARRYEVQSTPELFLIDIDGVILYRGPVRTVDSLKTRIQQRLAQLPAELSPPHEAITRIQPIPIEDDFTPNSPVAIVLAGNNVQYQPDTGPTLQGPGLMLWSADGTLVRQLDNIGTSGWLSGPRRIAFDPKNNRIYFCDTSKDQLVALDGFGRKLFASSVPDLHAAAVDEVTGDVWCLAVTQLNEGELVVLDRDGREKNRAPITGFDLAFSPADDAFWIAGRSITKINREGEVFSSLPLSDDGFTFADIAVDRQRGGAWVLELGHPDRDHSQNQLWKVAPDGAAMATHTFAKTDFPRSLAIVDGKPWLAVLKNYSRLSSDSPEYELRVFNQAGEFERALPISASSVAADGEASSVWVRESDQLLQLDDQGKQLRSIELPKDWKSVMMLVTGK